MNGFLLKIIIEILGMIKILLEENNHYLPD